MLVFSFDWALIASGFLDFNFVSRKSRARQGKKVPRGNPRLQVDFGMFPYATHHMTGYATLRPFVDTRVSFDLSPDCLDPVLVFRDHFNSAP